MNELTPIMAASLANSLYLLKEKGNVVSICQLPHFTKPVAIK